MLLQAQDLAGDLTVAQQQLQDSACRLVQAQEQVLSLLTALLQKTAVAEAAQAQLAAAALMQSMQQMVADAATKAATPPIATADTCDSLAAVIRSSLPAESGCGPAALLGVLQVSVIEDPKVQRIQELRAALAAALAEAANAAASPKVQQTGEVEKRLTGVDSVFAHTPEPAQQQLVKSFDPKLQRIQELVAALKSAAADASDNTVGSTTALQQHEMLNMSVSSMGAAAQQDAKQQRIHELRAALAEVLKERNLLKQQLAASSVAQAHSNALPAGPQSPKQASQQLPGQVMLMCEPGSALYVS